MHCASFGYPRRHQKPLLSIISLVGAAVLLAGTEPRCDKGPTFPCETAEDCAPFTPRCAVAECPSERGYCVFRPNGSAQCPCYERQTGPLAQCASGNGQCVIAKDGRAAWQCDPPDCSRGQTRCASPTSARACAPELAWTPAQQCAAWQKCLDGVCQGLPPDCTEGVQECTSASATRSCVNGRWTQPSACASGKCCGGRCAECRDGEARCVDDKAPQRCEACAWSALPACAGERVCEAGDCLPAYCGETKVWCERFARCVPYCDPDRCKALNATATRCTDVCQAPYRCVGSYQCCKTEGELNTCKAALVSDPCD